MVNKSKGFSNVDGKNSPAELPEEDLAARVVSIDHYKDYLLGFDGPHGVFSRIRRSMQQQRTKKGCILVLFTVPKDSSGTA